MLEKLILNKKERSIQYCVKIKTLTLINNCNYPINIYKTG